MMARWAWSRCGLVAYRCRFET